jgi:hypothetical protein
MRGKVKYFLHAVAKLSMSCLVEGSATYFIFNNVESVDL